MHYLGSITFISWDLFLTCIMGTRILPGPSQGHGDGDGKQGMDREQDSEKDPDLLWALEIQPQFLDCPLPQLITGTSQLLHYNLGFSVGPSDLGLTWLHLKLMPIDCPFP